ncbi:MAG TPA: hypothetical protein VFX82_08735, partial [Desulfobacterales bacterium]|nr:hypothetical protein [Desulfobacterales bacterium]
LEKAREGDTLTVAVEEISVPKRRISLALASTDDQSDWQSFTPGPRGSLGGLAEKLQNALAGRKK